MGSRLAKRGLLNLDDVLWVNPVEIAIGRLTALKLNGAASPYHEAGAILLAYLKLKLRLRIAGFDADFFAYDWRRSLTDLGQSLAEAMRSETASHLSLVAHSMGGLVARAAFSASTQARDKVSQLVMLGTPNYGSFAPAQAFRATYDVVQKIARLDVKHSPEELADQVFNTFPGLYEMLPSPEKFSKVDLYDVRSWPKRGPRPRATRLAAVKPVVDRLAPADSRFFLIAGVNQDTVTSLDVENGEFQYEVSSEGDGTVPLAFARLAGIPEGQTYYVEESHGSLPNNGAVESAVVDLLSLGQTTVLSNQLPAIRRTSRMVSEGELKEMAARAPGVGALGSTDYRHLLDSVAAAPGIERSVVTTGAASVTDPALAGPSGMRMLNQRFRNLTIGRRRQRQLDLTLAHGSITDVNARAYVLGVFRNVAPSGAAKAVDQRLGGAITDFTARRMLSGDVGAVFTVPAGRNQLPAEMVLFAGMGPFDQFNTDVQQLVAENAIRLLARSRIDEVATVLLGIGSGHSVRTVLQHLLAGFLRGLVDADPDQRFRGITVCEIDSARFNEMRSELYNLVRTSLFDEVELTLNEIEVPPIERVFSPVLEAGPEPVYVMVREEEPSAQITHYRVSLLGAGMKASVMSGVRTIQNAELVSLLDKFDKAVGGTARAAEVVALGQQFADLVLPTEVCTVLDSMRGRQLVVVHDAPTARIPWETLTINGWSPAITNGLSRRYLAENLPIATWLEERRGEPTLKLLLVVNPTGDLQGAEEEGDRVQKLVASRPDIDATVLAGERASKMAILTALRSGKYDCVHYAGHAFFDPRNRGRSGLLCAGREVLSGADLIGISNLPFLVFFNACEAGRVRGRSVAASTKPASVRSEQASGVAEALMRGGIAIFLSTYWPVADDAAKTFASTFYERLLAGEGVGSALLHGRKAIEEQRDWADYILYGNSEFILKQRPRQ
jgi:pimeloyl-ACP methyl ester carboxylesterase